MATGFEKAENFRPKKKNDTTAIFIRPFPPLHYSVNMTFNENAGCTRQMGYHCQTESKNQYACWRDSFIIDPLSIPRAHLCAQPMYRCLTLCEWIVGNSISGSKWIQSLLGPEGWQGAEGQRTQLCFNSKVRHYRKLEATLYNSKLFESAAVPGGSFHMTNSFHRDTRQNPLTDEDVRQARTHV